MAAIDMKSDGPNLLLTEGSNDCHVIAALCSFHGIKEGRLGFVNCLNDDGVLKKANALLMLDGDRKKETIGIVLDADSNLSSRWQSVVDKLSKYGYEFPDIPEPTGTILSSPGRPNLGIWIMPNNVSIGMLEDFCATLIDTSHLNVAKQTVANVEGTEVATFKDAHRSKAVIHTYLSWQDEPGRPLGQSITSKVLQPNKESAQSFVNWLSKLFPVKS